MKKITIVGLTPTEVLKAINYANIGVALLPGSRLLTLTGTIVGDYCPHKVAAFVYCLLATPGLKYVKAGHNKFTPDSGNVLSKLMTAYNGCKETKAHKLTVWRTKEEYALHLLTAYKVGTLPPLTGSPKKMASTLGNIENPVTKPLSKIGMLNIDAAPIVSPVSLQGTTTSLSNAGKRDLQSAVFVYYMIEEAYALHPEYQERRDIFVNNIARTMFDYLAWICWGEAKHAKGMKWVSSGFEKCDPRLFLPKTLQLFQEEDLWENGFGAGAWATINNTALMYFTKPPAVWFDHCVDLSHHGGLAFDKGYLWVQPESAAAYQQMLDAKRDDTVLVGLAQKTSGLFHINPAELRWFTYVVGSSDEQGPTCKPCNWGDEDVDISVNQDYIGGIEYDKDAEEEHPRPTATWVPERLEAEQ